MIPTLELQFKRLEDELSLFINDLQAFSENELLFSPDKDAWPALSVAEHLIIVEEIVVKGVRDKPDRRRAARTVKDRFFGLVVKLYLGLGLKVKTPTKAIIPTGNLLRPELEPRWKSARHSIKEYLEGLNEQTAMNLLMRHPISGPLDAESTIAFLAQHIHHHRKQLKRIKAALDARVREM